MTFEYRDDATCDTLVAQPDTDDNRKPVVFLSTSGLNNGVYLPVDRVEEVVAGIRDAARTAAHQTTSGIRSALEHVGIDTTGRDITVDGQIVDAARQTTGQDDTENPVVAYRSIYAPGLLFCRAHNQGWPSFAPLTSDDLPDGGICTWGPNDGPKCGRDVLIDEPSPAPAVGQPAEAHDTGRAALDRAFKDTRTRALIDAAEALTEACPDHGTGTTCTVRCYCDGADIIRRMADGSQP